MKILAIETSCDETAIAILQAEKSPEGTEFSILSNQISSQIKIHALYGGVVPNLAKREHIKNLPILLKRAIKESKIKKPDAVAVTHGPGLEPALWTGINFAQNLSKKWRVPLVPVNHLEGHIYSALMQNSKFKIQNKGIFPMLALIVSGGHTELVLSKNHLNYKILGETLDDAAGEAFDKVGRMLKLGYPGGPEISKLAKKGNPKAINFPRPMIYSKDLNFSFSGLKTAVLYKIREILAEKNSRRGRRRDKEFFSARILANIAASFEKAVVDVLVHKTVKAVKQQKITSMGLGGGVGANDKLREELKKNFPNILLPQKRFTGDNAAMIAVAGYYRFTKKKFNKNPKATGNLRLSKS
ncbi:tRNA (adenosine(37)-N6)-threonylcarbamoyltransferase complex transferase subunit TsaD [Candidatus Giovannonibacteria bacterium]|nr:tRNA (adenosine(37)-N6)-threonylcarbamoyltransferase complex transferase subunit TsaD [Candidatus Giovannonibacteria bacterium]